MSTKFPYKIDDNISLPNIVDNVSAVDAISVNRIKDAIIAVEKELGVKPSGVQGTVKDRFISLENVVQQLSTGSGAFAAGGDLSGTETNQKVVGIQNIPVSPATPTIGQTLVYDGTYYTPSTPSGGGGGDFIAGGDLSGTSTNQNVLKVRGITYPAGPLTSGNVVIASSTNSVIYGALNLANANSISGVLPSANLPSSTNSVSGTIRLTTDLGGSSTSPNVVGLRGISLSTTTPTTNQVLTFDGSLWKPSDLPESGAPTNAQYITLSSNGTLTNERVLTAGTNISFTDAGPGSTLTVNNTYSYSPVDATTSSKGVIQLAGDLAGTSTSVQVAKINGTSISSGTTSGQILRGTGANSASWGSLDLANTSSITGILPPANITNATTSVKGILQLSGDLDGTSSIPIVSGIQGIAISQTDPTTNQVLQYNGSVWQPATLPTYSPTDATTIAKGVIQLSGDLGGSATSPSVLKINTTSVSAGATSGQILRATGTNTASFGSIDLSNSSSITGLLPATNVENATTIAHGVIQLSQDLSGTSSAPIVSGIQGIAVSGTNPTTDQALVYDGSEWVPTTLSSATPADASDTIKGIVQLTRDLAGSASAPLVSGIQGRDVSNTAPSLNQVLQWNGSVWAPATVSAGGSTPDATNLIKGIIQLAGDLSGNAAAPVVSKINGTSISSGSTSGQILISDGTNSAAFATIDLSNSTSVSGVLPSANLTNATTSIIGAIKLAQDLGGTAALPNVIGLQGRSLSATAPTNGQAIIWNNAGSTWEPANIPTYTPIDATTSVKGIVQLTNDFAGTASSPVVAGIRGISVSNTTPTLNQVLQYNGTIWTPTTLTPYTPTDATTSVKGIVQLGGDLAGTGSVSATPRVSGINSTTVAAGATTGQVLRATGTNAAAFGAINLASSAAITGTLPAANMTNATSSVTGTVRLTNDFGGTATAPTVVRINGTTVAANATSGQVLRATGSNASSFGALDLANAASITGILPNTNQASQALGGDLSGTTASATVAKLQSVAVSNTTPTTNQVLQYNGTTWIPTTLSTYTPTDATTLAKGIIQLAGDLGGTAALPSVLKVNGISISGTPAIGNVPVATSTSAATWQAPPIGAPTGASYLTLSNDATLTSERVLTAGTNISIVDGGAGSTLTINSTYSYTPTDATTLAKGVIQLAGDLGGTSALPSVLKINGISISGTPATGNVLTATSTSAATWSAPTTFTAGGDLTGNNTSQTVAKVNGTTYQAGGSLVVGNSAYVSGTSATTYSALNLAGGSGWVTGVLPTANQANQTLLGDATGNTGAVVVAKINGTSVPATPTSGQVLTATSGTSAIWQTPTTYTPTDATTGAKGVVQLAGDLGGSAASPSVLRINGTLLGSPPSNVGMTLRATIGGATWGAIDLANTSAVTGILPAANQDAQTLGGDLSGTTSSATVARIRGTNVVATAPTLNQVLQYNGTNWTPATLTDASTGAKGIVQLAGDLGGTATSPIVSKINGISLPATPPSSGQILRATSSSASTWGALDLSNGSSITGTLSGTLVSGATGASAGTIVLGGGDLTGISSSVYVQGITGVQITNTGSAAGQMIMTTGTGTTASWITRSVNTGTGLTGGGTLGADRTLAIDTSVVATLSGGVLTSTQARGESLFSYNKTQATATVNTTNASASAPFTIMLLTFSSLAVGDIIDVQGFANISSTTGGSAAVLTISSSPTSGAGTIYSTMATNVSADSTTHMSDLHVVTTAGTHYIHFQAYKYTANGVNLPIYQRRLQAKVFRM